MKITPEYQFLGILILIIIFMSLMCSCTDVVPYTQQTLFPRHYAYEGMQPIEYTTRDAHQALDNNTSLLINNASVDCKKVYGFDGLYCKPYVADSKLDVFSGSNGSITCKGTNLTNSKGTLCLDQNQTKLLTTRGGNATGGGGQIGK